MNGTRGIQESESEDDIPISSIYNSKAVAKNMTEEKPNKEIVEHGDEMAEDDGTHSKKEDSGTHVIESKGKVDALVIDDDPKSSKEDLRCNSLPPSDEVGPQNRTKQKKKRKEKDNETATDRRSDLPHNSSMPPTTEIAPENGMKSKKKRKERSKEEKNLIADSEEVSENSTKAKKRRKERTRVGKSHEDNSASRSSVLKEDQSKQDEVKDAGNMSKDVNVRNEQDQKPSSESIDIDSDQLASEKKNKKKRKKKNTILENDENVNVEVPLLPKEEKNRSMKESKEKNVVRMSSQARTLSNGLIIEDLESGKSNGKIAARGRKIKVHYIGKLNRMDE